MLHNNRLCQSPAVISECHKGKELPNQRTSKHVPAVNLGGAGSKRIECAHRWLFYVGSSAQHAPQACQDCHQFASQRCQNTGDVPHHGVLELWRPGISTYSAALPFVNPTTMHSQQCGAFKVRQLRMAPAGRTCGRLGDHHDVDDVIVDDVDDVYPAFA